MRSHDHNGICEELVLPSTSVARVGTCGVGGVTSHPPVRIRLRLPNFFGLAEWHYPNKLRASQTRLIARSTSNYGSSGFQRPSMRSICNTGRLRFVGRP